MLISRLSTTKRLTKTCSSVLSSRYFARSSWLALARTSLLSSLEKGEPSILTWLSAFSLTVASIWRFSLPSRASQIYWALNRRRRILGWARSAFSWNCPFSSISTEERDSTLLVPLWSRKILVFGAIPLIRPEIWTGRPFFSSFGVVVVSFSMFWGVLDSTAGLFSLPQLARKRAAAEQAAMQKEFVHN